MGLPEKIHHISSIELVAADRLYLAHRSFALRNRLQHNQPTVVTMPSSTDGSKPEVAKKIKKKRSIEGSDTSSGNPPMKKQRSVLSASEANASKTMPPSSSSSSATAPTKTTDATAATQKKRKRPSPFRIKVGCVVALRHKPGVGNRVAMLIQQQQQSSQDGSSEDNAETTKKVVPLHSLAGNHNHVEVWTDPVPGRDQGLALIGRRVRCVFVRKLKTKTDDPQQPVAISTKKYIVEGEVVSIVDYYYDNTTSKVGERQQRDGMGGLTVELLVDQELLTSVPFLERTDEAVDVSQLKKESAKRAYKNEERIRGKNKAIVKVTLEDPSGVVPHSEESKANHDDNLKDKDGDDNTDATTKKKKKKRQLIAKWAIRKRVPAKPGLPIPPPPPEEPQPKKAAKKSTQNNTDTGNSSTPNEGLNGAKTATASDSNKPPNATKMNGSNNGSTEDAKSTDGKKADPPKKKRKPKPPPPATTKFLGDGNDDPPQQQQNWRWLASRYHDLYASTFNSRTENPEQSADNIFAADDDEFDSFEHYNELLSSSGGALVGEVVEVSPSKDPSSNTLALVTIRRLLLPEHTASGRTSQHNPTGSGILAVFDDFDAANRVEQQASAKTDVSDTEEASDDSSTPESITFQIPIEELVIVSRQINRDYSRDQQFTKDKIAQPDSHDVDELNVAASYSLRRNAYVPLSFMAEKDSSKLSSSLSTLGCCHRCRTALLPSNLTKCELTTTCLLQRSNGNASEDVAITSVWWCKFCLKALRSKPPSKDSESSQLPCCTGACDCRECHAANNKKRQLASLQSDLKAQGNQLSSTSGKESADETSGTGLTPFSGAASLVKSLGSSDGGTVDFDIPPDFINLNLLPLSSGKQVTSMTKSVATIKAKPKPKKLVVTTKTDASGEKKRKAETASRSKSPKKAKTKDGKTSSRSQSPIPQANTIPLRVVRKMSTEDYSVFKPTCSRFMDFAATKAWKAKKAEDEEDDPSWAMDSFGNGDRPRNLREVMAKRKEADQPEKVEETKLSRRALRANQRRFMKDVTTLGASSLALDTLAGREQQLRFDRSGIHAWGVYTDVEIAAEEMIIEYRGVLIGNSQAEKMQAQYERENIGSDYMFTIDEYLVCDATKEGNVARFINASCDPNCYSKIIKNDGRARIVIYAKRDIQVGEELSYDYKFALEYNKERRIPCHCGAAECRGYLNWVSLVGLVLVIVCWEGLGGWVTEKTHVLTRLTFISFLCYRTRNSKNCPRNSNLQGRSDMRERESSQLSLHPKKRHEEENLVLVVLAHLIDSASRQRSRLLGFLSSC